VQHQLVAALGTAMKEHRAELTRSLLDEAGPLGVLRADLTARLAAIVHGNDRLTEQLGTLQQTFAIEEATAAERALGTAKGLDYEELVGRAVEALHAPLEDVVYQTGAEPGADGGKVGDIVVEINPAYTQGHRARVVVEAKCRKLSMRASSAELERAMTNREAQAGLLVFASTDLAPLAGRSIRVLPGNRVIAVFDADGPDTITLEAACAIARASAARAAMETSSECDLACLDQHLRRLMAVLDEAKAIARGVTAARKGVDQIDSAYSTMRLSVSAVIADIQEVIIGSPAQPAARK
jgi:hypothetical protein